MSEQYKVMARRAIEEVYNGGKLDLVDELAADDFVIHLPSRDIHGSSGAKQYIATLRESFPDIHFTIDDQVCEGDTVVTRWTASGTHTGEFQGIPPTGRQGVISGVDIDRIADEKVVECWVSLDELGLLQQLGVIPTPEPVG